MTWRKKCSLSKQEVCLSLDWLPRQRYRTLSLYELISFAAFDVILRKCFVHSSQRKKCRTNSRIDSIISFGWTFDGTEKKRKKQTSWRDHRLIYIDFVQQVSLVSHSYHEIKPIMNKDNHVYLDQIHCNGRIELTVIWLPTMKSARCFFQELSIKEFYRCRIDICLQVFSSDWWSIIHKSN